MENALNRIKNLFNKQPLQVEDEDRGLLIDPEILDGQLNSGMITPDEYQLYKNILMKAQKDRTITPYDLDTVNDARQSATQGAVRERFFGMQEPNYVTDWPKLREKLKK